MISGSVTSGREAVVRLKVQGTGGQEQEVSVIIDTGFTGWLTLPRSVINHLKLPWLTKGRALLANGQLETFDVHVGTLLWDGQPLRVMIDAVDSDPLLGMSLLQNCELHIQNIDGGNVTINRISHP
jgi:clan AA aspartic protease